MTEVMYFVRNLHCEDPVVPIKTGVKQTLDSSMGCANIHENRAPRVKMKISRLPIPNSMELHQGIKVLPTHPSFAKLISSRHIPETAMLQIWPAFERSWADKFGGSLCFHFIGKKGCPKGKGLAQSHELP